MQIHHFRRPTVRNAANLILLLGALNGCAFLARQATIAYLNVNALFSARDIEMVIQRSFIEKYKDRVSIHATFTVDKAMQNPVANMFDGDLHLTGRAPEIALPVVAEIANAASEKEVTDLVHDAEGTGKPLKISGVWRIWPEHAGGAKEEQGAPVAISETNFPEHVFEIHPVTRIGEVEIHDTFRPVEGFSPGDTHTTFDAYEKVECKLTVKPKTVSIVTQKGLYNDVEFVMEIAEDRQIEATGGRFVMASVRDVKGEMVVERLRMVFARGTPPEMAVRLLKRGDRMHVWGIPRLNFAEISRRVRGSQKDPSLLVKPLPYEIIIIGVYKDKK